MQVQVPGASTGLWRILKRVVFVRTVAGWNDQDDYLEWGNYIARSDGKCVA